ncbi:MAG TPA: hypothetical protein VF904_02780, partial [Anaeromyxobacteraceae bacterium]
TTGEMMLALPGRRFMVGLDPYFFYRGDPARYRLWFDLVRRPPPNPALVIQEAFASRYVLCESPLEEYQPLLRALLRDPGATLKGRSRLWMLFELGAR